MDMIVIFYIFSLFVLIVCFGLLFIVYKNIEVTDRFLQKVTPLLNLPDNPIEDQAQGKEENQITPEYADNRVELQDFTPQKGLKVKIIEEKPPQKQEENEITPL